jgi:hypothetical protein
MYSLSQLLQGARDPYLGAMEINRIFSEKILELFRSKPNFFGKDWDNLIILDACRYDLFEDSNFRNEKVGWQWSDGSNSEEFIQTAVNNNKLNNTVWVTANPWVSKYKKSIFKVIELWDTEWDNSISTVPAESVTKRAIEAVSKYPNKRLVVHFMQPHYPFVGDHTATLPSHASFSGDGIRADDTEELTIWEHIREGNVDCETVWRAYEANLEYVLPNVDELIDKLPGKIVVTSDHGNAFGSRAFPVPFQLF